ncbi:MAG: YbjN domain-containing protein [Candidatus Methanomethylophilaceae archaeon]|nr:YbjN domain-containing protein [Candidatus Methanomethylophilaceae archaeon]
MFGRKGDTRDSLYKKICKIFDANGIEYKSDDDNYIIVTPQMGDDLPITMFITVSEGTVEFRCKLAFDASEDNFQIILDAINKLNSEIALGAFVIDSESGWVMYRYSYIYIDVKPNADLILSLLKMAIDTVDAHDGALKALMPIKKDDKYTMMFV